MITAAKPVPRQAARWQRELAQAIGDPAELLRGAGSRSRPCRRRVRHRPVSALRVPRGFVTRMRKGRSRRSAAAAVLPLGAELDEAPGFDTDPIGDQRRWRRRACCTNTTAGRCCWSPVPARCIAATAFAANFPMPNPGPARPVAAGAGLSARRSQSARGNPQRRRSAVAVRPTTGRVAGGTGSHPHLERLRIHSRQPIVLPERVDDGLLVVLARTACNGYWSFTPTTRAKSTGRCRGAAPTGGDRRPR